jgi:glycosyltransferase involved in cell wall biosynthesis
MSAPDISVVMAVHDGADRVSATLRSVLTQDVANLEFIVVDDGSTDGTAAELARWAREDPRLRVLTNPANVGLTSSLIRGCTEARGQFIARQDCGDRSLPGRLATQMEWLVSHPDAVMVSCNTRVFGLFGEVVFEKRLSAAHLRASLGNEAGGRFAGPTHHGSVMMRAAAYRRVGGYRLPFIVAQDLDLWLRLAELGDVGVVDVFGYEADALPTGISAQRIAQQRNLAALAAELALARRAGKGEAHILARHARDLTSAQVGGVRESSDYRYAAHLYFLGRCVRKRHPDLARRYFRAGIARCPWHLRSWLGLASSLIGTAGRHS